MKLIKPITSIVALAVFSCTSKSGNVENVYHTNIRPIFVKHCISCHGASKQKSNYRLDTFDYALSRGDYGEPPVIFGYPEKSMLWEMVSSANSGLTEDFCPPPNKKKLSKGEIQAIYDWIKGEH